MLYRNIKTGGLIIASAKFKGKDWVAVDQLPKTASEDPVDLPEEEAEEIERPKRGRKKK